MEVKKITCFNCRCELSDSDIERMKRDADRYGVPLDDILDICTHCNQVMLEAHQRAQDLENYDPYYGY